ncbi:nuclear speckle splicing regulatory protein 1 [Drosophila sulfurigaster albostrigata]|uniref:nuclear speckle splicing regulatory protein 1 n=1 Tax=Drosophila sulfurigaster albostrigata TaxID=89887 RepID=UPI002D21BDA7|nr:nuclear speckle splicing regulatory protein 1 [Drosophila sulfurigaster albostrigata]
MSKQFGLIIPGQQKKQLAVTRPTPASRPSVFDESSNSASDEDVAGPPQMRANPKAGGVVVSGPSLMERRVARNIQAKALAEDPTIFQYDELYDDMDSKREEAKETKKKEPRKAKYISRLMEHAERRKLENELRIERQVQKDREAEGEKFKDKDTYVTAAYRKKLESIRQLQEQDERDEYLEAIGDVTKQKDLDGFYRHLYEQKLGGQQPKPKPPAGPTEDASSSGSKQRSYRKRRESAEEEQLQSTAEAAERTVGSDATKPGNSNNSSSNVKAHLANNIDADSDFSIDESSDEETEKKEEQSKAALASEDAKHKTKPKTVTEKSKSKEESPATESEGRNGSGNKETEKEKEQEKQEEPEPSKVPKATVDRTKIWRKRTVGEVFDAALERYHQRKLARRA